SARKVRRSARISHGAGAGVGGGMRGEIAVELREQGEAIGEAILCAGGGERRILRRGSAVDDEARAGKRLEDRGERGVAHPVVRPSEPPPQRERRGGVERDAAVEA